MNGFWSLMVIMAIPSLPLFVAAGFGLRLVGQSFAHAHPLPELRLCQRLVGLSMLEPSVTLLWIWGFAWISTSAHLDLEPPLKPWLMFTLLIPMLLLLVAGPSIVLLDMSNPPAIAKTVLTNGLLRIGLILLGFLFYFMYMLPFFSWWFVVVYSVIILYMRYRNLAHPAKIQAVSVGAEGLMIVLHDEHQPSQVKPNL